MSVIFTFVVADPTLLRSNGDVFNEFAIDFGSVESARGVGRDVGIGGQIEDGGEESFLAVAIAVAVQWIII